MALEKFDPGVASREVKLIRSPKGDKRNIRILMARGLKVDVAVGVVEKIRAESITNPEAYVSEVLKDSSNLDPAYLTWDTSDDIFDPALWAALRAEAEAEIEYTTPIRKRLQQRARARAEELHLKDFYAMDERDYFWRTSTRKFNTGSTSNPSTTMANPRHKT